MREIKYRVWSIRNEKYIYFTIFEKWGVINHKLDDTVSTVGSDRLLLTDNPEHHIWEQYTGLKDKNGVEIYEGDIVSDGKHPNMIIRWDKIHARFAMYAVGRLDAMGSGFGVQNGWRVEVIGNIHENPELMA